MKTFRLQPHEIGYLKLLYSTFAGMDYATANAVVKMKSRNDEQIMKTIREVQIQSLNGLASEYIRAALIMKKVLNFILKEKNFQMTSMQLKHTQIQSQ